MKFQGIDSDPLLEDNEPKKMSHCDAKDTFKGVQVYVVLLTSQKMVQSLLRWLAHFSDMVIMSSRYAKSMHTRSLNN